MTTQATEERPGFAGALPSGRGVWGAVSWPPTLKAR
jgi:hypothetical protein